MGTYASIHRADRAFARDIGTGATVVALCDGLTDLAAIHCDDPDFCDQLAAAATEAAAMLRANTAAA